MAVLLLGKFIYLAHPNTASSATTAALLEAFPNAYDVRPHHASLDEVRGPNGINCIMGINRKRRWNPDLTQEERKNLTEPPDLYQGNELVFCTIRNPYDLLTTRYVRSNTSKPFDEFVRSFSSRPHVEGGKIYHFVPTCDRVLRYENLQEELNQLMADLDLPPVPLPRTNKTAGKKPWRTYYTPEAFAVVNERFGDEFSRFYKPETG